MASPSTSMTRKVSSSKCSTSDLLKNYEATLAFDLEDLQSSRSNFYSRTTSKDKTATDALDFVSQGGNYSNYSTESEFKMIRAEAFPQEPSSRTLNLNNTNSQLTEHGNVTFLNPVDKLMYRAVSPTTDHRYVRNSSAEFLSLSDICEKSVDHSVDHADPQENEPSHPQNISVNSSDFWEYGDDSDKDYSRRESAKITESFFNVIEKHAETGALKTLGQVCTGEDEIHSFGGSLDRGADEVSLFRTPNFPNTCPINGLVIEQKKVRSKSCFPQSSVDTVNVTDQKFDDHNNVVANLKFPFNDNASLLTPVLIKEYESTYSAGPRSKLFVQTSPSKTLSKIHHSYTGNQLNCGSVTKSGERRKPRTYSHAVPSQHCHICSRRPTESSPHAVCGNLLRGRCRKTVCTKCFQTFRWDIQAARNGPPGSWQCPHCRGECPQRAQCVIYNRTSDRRRRKLINHRKRKPNVVLDVKNNEKRPSMGLKKSKTLPVTIRFVDSKAGPLQLETGSTNSSFSTGKDKQASTLEGYSTIGSEKRVPKHLGQATRFGHLESSLKLDLLNSRSSEYNDNLDVSLTQIDRPVVTDNCQITIETNSSYNQVSNDSLPIKSVLQRGQELFASNVVSEKRDDFGNINRQYPGSDGQQNAPLPVTELPVGDFHGLWSSRREDAI